MTVQISNQHKPFEIEDKRFYIPGVVVAYTCPKCKRKSKQDLEEKYLSYPMANKPTQMPLCCYECDYEWEVTVKITVDIELVEDNET